MTTTPSDPETYRALERRMKQLYLTKGLQAIMSPEFQAVWQQVEEIKNRHGGKPPVE